MSDPNPESVRLTAAEMADVLWWCWRVVTEGPNSMRENFGRPQPGSYVGHYPVTEWNDRLDVVLAAVPRLLAQIDGSGGDA